MVTDKQVKRLLKLMQSETTLTQAAAKAGMDEKTARRYCRLGQVPSEVKLPHPWRTRSDPFAEVWEAVRGQLRDNPGLEAKTLFADLQRRYPGQFAEGQLRTLQRRIKHWRALEGPPKEVFFPQRYVAGERSQSDFTDMKALGVTLQRCPFAHLLYHFVLPYSNWETGVVGFSESFERLSEGLQRALWRLGGVPCYPQTDRLSAAVHKAGHPDEFTPRYQALLRHSGLQGRKTPARLRTATWSNATTASNAPWSKPCCYGAVAILASAPSTTRFWASGSSRSIAGGRRALPRNRGSYAPYRLSAWRPANGCRLK